MAKRAEDRFQRALEFASAFREALRGEVGPRAQADAPRQQAAPPEGVPGGVSSPAPISAANVSRVTELRRLGRGVIRKIQYSPDGRTLAVASSIGIWLYDAGDFERTPRLIGENTCVGLVAWSPDGRFLASAGSDGTVRVWDAARGGTRADARSA